MIRNIEYNIDINGISPKTKQFGGVQGDHKVTKVVFNLADDLYQQIKGCKYRFDVYDGEGGVIHYETKVLETSKLEHLLENATTKCGGTVKVVLVFTNSKDNETEYELYSFPAILTLKSLPEGRAKEGEDYTSVSTLAESAKAAAEQAKEIEETLSQAVKDANDIKKAYDEGQLKGEKGEKGEKGDTGPQGPQGEPGKDAGVENLQKGDYSIDLYNEYLDSETSAVSVQFLQRALDAYIDYFNKNIVVGMGGEAPVITLKQTEEGAIFTVTDKNGTNSVTILNGTDGMQGEQGKDGYTPIKGIDYFTEGDKEELITSILANFEDASEVAM